MENLEDHKKSSNIYDSLGIKGYNMAVQSRGETNFYESCLSLVSSEYKGEEDNNKEFYETKVKECEQENESLKQDILKSQDGLTENKSKLNNLKAKPNEIQPDNEFNSLYFYFSLSLLVLLTLYLFFFYTSACYMAFFRDVIGEIRSQQNAAVDLLFISIFDHTAIYKSIKTGNIFILLFPIVFISLAFIVHMTYHEIQTPKKLITFIFFFTFTFSFDILIAYRIGSQLFTIQVLVGLSDEKYSIDLALRDINFYAVIFAGILVYILWGVIFDYFMDEYSKFKPLSRKSSEFKKNIKHFRSKIKENSNMIRNNEKIILHYKYKLAKNTRHYEELESRLIAFTQGWLRYDNEKIAGKSKEIITVYKDLIKKLKR